MLEGKEWKKGTGSLSEQIIDENSPNLWKELDSWIQEANRTSIDFNSKGLLQGRLY